MLLSAIAVLSVPAVLILVSKLPANGGFSLLHFACLETAFVGVLIAFRRGRDLQRALEGMQLQLTERARIEEELRRSEERLRLALESVPMGTWELDVRSNLMRGSELIEAIFGVAKGAFARNYQEYLNLILEEDRPLVIWRIGAALRGATDVFAIEHRILRSDGLIRRVDCRGKVYRDAAGKAGRVVATVVDITVRTQAHEELEWKSAFLEAQINSSPDGILGVNPQGKKILQNQRMVEIWKLPPEIASEEDDSSQLRYATAQTRNPQAFLATVNHLYSHPSEIGHDEIELKDGRVLDRYSSPLVGRDGQHYGRIWIFRDLTQKKLSAAQAIRRQRLESIGALASGIVHDLNNALAPILMATETLRMDCCDPEMMRMLELIRNSAQRGSEMVSQVLTFARGKKSERGLVPIEQLISEMVSIARQTFPKSIEIKTDISREVWSVSANRTQLHQVLLNLCVNARDAMANGGLLMISAKNARVEEMANRAGSDEKSGFYLVLTVADTGCGMSDEVRNRIFDPFFSTKAPEKGTGLGLSTVQGIVKSHGGFINVRSEIGKGTEFNVYLPSQEKPVASESDIPLPPLPMGCGELILVVDDETAIRNVTTQALELSGYRVITAKNGTEALAEAKRHLSELPLVIMDLEIPGMDGIAMILAIQKLSSLSRFIVLGGADLAKNTRNLRDLKVDAFMQKPVRADELLRTVHHVLSERAHRKVGGSGAGEI